MNLFANGKLLPYSEILMLSRHEILTDAKILLPFWYTVPILSWLLSLFFKKPGQSEKKQDKKTQSKQNEPEKKEKRTSSKLEMKKAIEKIEKDLIPEDSSLEQELDYSVLQWNKQITKQSREQLTEDVNCLIRDYIRTTIRSLHSVSFDIQRIKNLADTLVKSPSLQKIKETNHLNRYVQLYILKLVKNS